MAAATGVHAARGTLGQLGPPSASCARPRPPRALGPAPAPRPRRVRRGYAGSFPAAAAAAVAGGGGAACLEGARSRRRGLPGYVVLPSCPRQDFAPHCYGKQSAESGERASERVQAPKLPAATSPPPPLAGGPAPAQLHGLRLCAGKDTHADLEEALSSLRGLGSRTLTLRFLNPVVFVLGGSAALIHFPRVLTTCRTLLLPLLAACVKNASFFLLQRPHFLEWRGQALERLMVTVRGPESSDWKFGKTSRRK